MNEALLYILPFAGTALLMLGFFLLQVCLQHEIKDVKAELVIALTFIIVAISMWVKFSNLVS